MRERHLVLHGYALERSDLLLEFYDQEKVEQDFNELAKHRDLSVDQKARVIALQAELKHYSDEANQLFRFVRAGDERSVENWSAAGSTDRSLEKIQFLLRQIEDEEERLLRARDRSEEHTSELQSLMRTSYAVFCLTKKTNHLTALS